MKHVFHVKPSFKWVRRVRDGEALSSGMDPIVVTGLFSLESDHTSSAQSSGLPEDTPQALAGIVAGAHVEQLAGNASLPAFGNVSRCCV